MKSKIVISILEPCHENWYSMTPCQKSRFCNKCEKKVYDFTNSSDRDIIQQYNKTDNLCGRFSSTQLDRELIVPREKKLIWVATVSAILSFLTVSTHQSLAQARYKIEQKLKAGSTKSNINLEEKVEVSGIVLDDNNDPLPNIVIRISPNEFQKTDSLGQFCFLADNCKTIHFFDENEEYSDASYKIDGAKSNIQIICDKYIYKTKPNHITMGTVCVVKTIPKRTFFGRIFHTIGSWFK